MSRFWTSQCERISRWGLLRTFSYYLFGVAADKVGIRLWDAYEYPQHAATIPKLSVATFAMLNSMADWTPRDLELLNEYQGISLLPLYEGFFADGDKCAVARWENTELACVCWSHPTKEYPLAPGTKVFLIKNCFTLPQYRGQGLYPTTLNFACSTLRLSERPPVRIFVDCSAFNFASQKGILKAGFKPAGRIVRAFKQSWSWAHPHADNGPQPFVASAS
jgi:hypothetical protein